MESGLRALSVDQWRHLAGFFDLDRTLQIPVPAITFDHVVAQRINVDQIVEADGELPDVVQITVNVTLN